MQAVLDVIKKHLGKIIITFLISGAIGVASLFGFGDKAEEIGAPFLPAPIVLEQPAQ